ncbi:alpha-L-fucosidase [Brevibacterium sp.]|uniref:alpha-L-fucosidase n=1 Tax=Brevibacterium sp. TaxID=1701 RepID=UPI0025BBD191|nr:alpha-L-fucosidase [Brevibacterium sp.]
MDQQSSQQGTEHACPQRARLGDFDTVPVQSWEELDARPLPQWYAGAKFGIFVHWGVFSVPAWRTLNDEQFGSYAEWYYASVYGKYRNADSDFHARMFPGRDYRDLAADFRAELFDPGAWAELFRRAGAGYVVLTSKHHDGYCLWPTENEHKEDWNSGAVGPRRDLLGDLAEAVRAQGMRMGLYYSIPEWETHRSHRVDGEHFIPEADAERYGIPEDDYPREILHQQWVELNERYAPAVIYTDGGEWDFSEDYTQTRRMLSWLYTESPNAGEVVVNDRMHVGMPGVHGDVYSTEYQDLDGYGTVHPWEEGRGVGGSFGFNRAESVEDYASAADLLALLAQTVAGGGNLLLNVGPTADGRIPPLQQERLLQIGAWLETNGEAIYQTTPVTDLRPEAPGVFATARGDARYVIVTGRPEAPIRLSLDPGTEVAGWELLGADEQLAGQLLDIRPQAGALELVLRPAARWTGVATEALPLVIRLRTIPA